MFKKIYLSFPRSAVRQILTAGIHVCSALLNAFLDSVHTYSLLRAERQRNDGSSGERGNVLFFILIAIALLGGLTVVMSDSTDSSGETGSYERREILATQVLNYARSLELGIQNLLSRGCSENDLSFWHDSDGNGTEDGSDDYYNANSPTDHSCHLFWPEGAGLEYVNIGAKVGTGLTMVLGTTGSPRALKDIGDSNRTDIYMGFNGNVTAMNPFCETINRMAGVSKTGTASANVFDPETTAITNMYDTKFTGSFVSPVVTVFDIAPISGKRYFCVGHSPTHTVFVYAIYAR